MNETTTLRRFRVVPAARAGKDPRHYLAGLLDGFAAIGLKVPAGAAPRVAEAVRLTREANAIRGDLSVEKHERVHRSDQLLRQAGGARVAALGVLNGPAIEAAAAKIAAPAIDRIAAALDRIPPDVGDAEAAMLAGPEIAEAWAQVVTGDALVGKIWDALDLARRLGVIPVELDRRDLSSKSGRLGDVLQSGGGSERFFVPEAHRATRPELVTPKVTASRAISRGADPGVYPAAEARNSLVAYADQLHAGGEHRD